MIEEKIHSDFAVRKTFTTLHIFCILLPQTEITVQGSGRNKFKSCHSSLYEKLLHSITLLQLR